jgi:hypothetical protein
MAYSSSQYYADVLAGRVFIGSTAVGGTAFPISTGTAVTFGLWNTSSDKNAVIMELTVGFTSGTIALGEVGIANQYCGFATATAAPLSAFTDGTPKNALVGSGAASSMRFTPSAATLSAGGTALWWSGASFTSATGAQPVSNIRAIINGSIIVPPGSLIFVCGSVAQTALCTMSLTWAEVPK